MFSETIELTGHIIDSLTLPKVLDEILDRGASFEILSIRVGERPTDRSRAEIRVSAGTEDGLAALLRRLSRLGAVPLEARDARLAPCRRPGVFPDGFYSTTNLPTQVRLRGRWLDVRDVEMDCGILVAPAKGTARAVPITDVRKGDLVVCGHDGVKVLPIERSRDREAFGFMASAVSSEKPKAREIRDTARGILEARAAGRRVLVVAGPAVVHVGGAEPLERIIRAGWVDALFAGNGFATHDIERAIYGTALGVDLDRGVQTPDGHDHHMRAINAIRGAGGIRKAVRKGLLVRGVMHACVERGVETVLAGSIRDDGPLPDVVTDTLEAQAAMRRAVRGVGIAVILSSTLHGIATGNLLPAAVKTVCVDINPAVVTKFADRGTFQIIGLVMDAGSFLRELERCLPKRRPRPRR